MLSIDEAIAHAREVANTQKGKSGICLQNGLECEHFSDCLKCAEEHEQLAEWLEELKEMRKNQGQIADFWYQEGISRESKLIFDKIEEIKNRYNVEDFAIIGVLIKVQEIALEIAEELKEGRNNENYNKEES